MVDNLINNTPPQFQNLLLKNCAALAQYEDALLPEGARATVVEPDPDAGTGNGGGMRQFVYTRSDLPASPALTFEFDNGAYGTPTKNAYRSKQGYLWVQWPQIYVIQLNAATPVPVADVVTCVGTSPTQYTRINWRRLTVGVAPGTPIFTISNNAISLVSQANDNSILFVELYARMRQP